MNNSFKRIFLIFWRVIRRLYCVAPVLLPLIILIGTGLRGLDFGTHWDEKYYQIRPVRTMLTTGILLPQYYGYPSFNYWVNAAGLLPDAVAALKEKKGTEEQLLDALDSSAYHIRLRAIYLVITSLSVLWVYLLVLTWRQSWIEALLAALFLGMSWEVAYHIRWVATDGMLMQFGALTILLTMVAQMKTETRWWHYLAAAAAALGFGTKYPGGLLIVPVLLSVYLLWDKRSYRSLASTWVKSVFIFVGVYLVTTPATILQPVEFLKGIVYEINHYSTGHAGHTVSSGLQHGWRMLVYFSSILFSHYAPIAWFCFLLVVVGGYALVKESFKAAMLFLCFPVLYLLYFCTQRAMVARNLLVVVPFLAILAARGAMFLWGKLKFKSKVLSLGNFRFTVLQSVFAAFIVTVFAVNAVWLVYAAETIADRRTDRFVRETAAYISTNGSHRFFLSPRVQARLTKIEKTPFANVTDDPSQADRVILYSSEGQRRWQDWQANNFWLTETWFGPYEMNFNVYPNWWGDERIVVMTMKEAKRNEILIVK
jgi:4-amino-4-deoxy-L-arabinose transferase-like glycosyltransferase